MRLSLFISLITTSISNPLLLDVPKPIEDLTLGGGVDFSQVASRAQLSCLAGAGYAVAWVRGYSSDGQGSFDNSSITNYQNAYPAVLGVHVYISPQLLSKKSGATQLTETYNGLKRAGITGQIIWLQVVSASQWSNNYIDNIQFIQSYMNQLKVLKVEGGIYTSNYDWTAITNNWTGASSLMLWYYHVYGNGLSNESPPNYYDFMPFGGWSGPVIKQYAQREAVCGVTPLNRNVFTTNSPVKRFLMKSEESIE